MQKNEEIVTIVEVFNFDYVMDSVNYENREVNEIAFVHLDQIFMQNLDTIVQVTKLV